MTNPTDPPPHGYPPRPPDAPRPTTGPYARPQPPPQGRPQAPPPQPPGPSWGANRPDQARPASKGFLGTLLDTNFDHMITTKLIKVVYTLALVVITLMTLVIMWYGFGFAQWNATLGLMTLAFAPIFWIVQVLITRMILEFLINQFKISEYLRIIKDRGEIGR